MMVIIREKFNIRIQNHEEIIKKYNNIFSLISTARLISFIAIIYLTYKATKIEYNKVYIIIAVFYL